MQYDKQYECNQKSKRISRVEWKPGKFLEHIFCSHRLQKLNLIALQAFKMEKMIRSNLPIWNNVLKNIIIHTRDKVCIIPENQYWNSQNRISNFHYGIKYDFRIFFYRLIGIRVNGL